MRVLWEGLERRMEMKKYCNQDLKNKIRKIKNLESIYKFKQKHVLTLEQDQQPTEM